MSSVSFLPSAFEQNLPGSSNINAISDCPDTHERIVNMDELRSLTLPKHTLQHVKTKFILKIPKIDDTTSLKLTGDTKKPNRIYINMMPMRSLSMGQCIPNLKISSVLPSVSADPQDCGMDSCQYVLNSSQNNSKLQNNLVVPSTPTLSLFRVIGRGALGSEVSHASPSFNLPAISEEASNRHMQNQSHQGDHPAVSGPVKIHQGPHIRGHENSRSTKNIRANDTQASKKEPIRKSASELSGKTNSILKKKTMTSQNTNGSKKSVKFSTKKTIYKYTPLV